MLCPISRVCNYVPVSTPLGVFTKHLAYPACHIVVARPGYCDFSDQVPIEKSEHLCIMVAKKVQALVSHTLFEVASSRFGPCYSDVPQLKCGPSYTFGT